ncbi:hypothetical protein ES703_125488 [subsurface metagenome]
MLAPFREKAGNHNMLAHFHIQSFKFIIQGGLDAYPLDTYAILVLVIIGKHQFGLFIPELSTCELVIYISNLHPHLLYIEESIVALFTGKVIKMPGKIL